MRSNYIKGLLAAVLVTVAIGLGASGSEEGKAGAGLPDASLRQGRVAALVAAKRRQEPYRLFPALLTAAGAKEARVSGRAFWVPDEEEFLADEEFAAERAIPLMNDQILAFYGHPLSKRMGILGEYPKDKLAEILKGYAALYDAVNGNMGVRTAFYIIYGTCWPEGEIGYLPNDVLEEYIAFAQERGMMVFVDHQIGKYGVDEAMRRILPFLKYPNVHLALDPEWRTTSPMKEIGSISAEELNTAQAMMQDYIVAEGIPGVRMLVVHQFNHGMIRDRGQVRADFERVLLIHTADGFGIPALKRQTYNYVAQASNMPLKGFKLFMKSRYPGAGFDEPLLRPEEVMALEPRPILVMYQ